MALVLVGRDWSSRDEAVDAKHLAGTTADGFRITLGVVDGKLQNFDTVVRTECSGGRTWRSRWYPADGAPVPFHQDGRRFRVVERDSHPDRHPPSRFAFAMDGALADGAAAVSGRIHAQAYWGRGDDSIYCRGTTTFRARARD